MLKANGESSLSELVRKEISTMPHIKAALGEGIVNYSALARKFLPIISQKLGKTLNEESLIVAIKRHADEISKSSLAESYLDLFANADITLQDNMSYGHFKKTEKVVARAEELFRHTEWKAGEIRIFIQGAEQVMVIAKSDKIEELLEEFEGEKLFSIGEIALLTLRMPMESYSTYGVIAEAARHMAQKGISIEMITTPPDLHFLVNEKDAERAYSTLKTLIGEAKEIRKKPSKK